MEPQDQAFSHRPMGVHLDQDPNTVNNVSASLSNHIHDSNPLVTTHSRHGSIVRDDTRAANGNSNSNSNILPSSRTSSSTTLINPSSSSSLSARLPSAPPANPPPRFFTRPYRRTQDHHHSHHGSIHNPSGGQSSSSIGVRSAFRDFVLPAQIILICSILNALWPTISRTVTTALEFLVLVLSSYSACARRSDDCYFLEPLIHDGQEAVYVEAIQWTLRSVFCVLLVGGTYFVSKKIQKIWIVLVSNNWTWLMTYQKRLWVYVVRIFPWKITRSNSQSTGQSLRHQRKPSSAPATDQFKDTGSLVGSPTPSRHHPRRAGTSSAIDTDAFSAGSGSESKARLKIKARKGKASSSDSIHDASISSNRSPSYSHANSIVDNAGKTTSLASSGISTQSRQLKAKSTKTRVADADTRNGSEMGIETTTAMYETADDGYFISTDRRRRRKMRGLKSNTASNSTESLVKPIAPSSREQESSSINPNTTIQPTSNTLPEAQVAKASDSNHASLVCEREKKHTHHEHLSRDSNTTTAPSKPNISVSKAADTSESQATELKFIHPLHALNSTSPIVRSKSSHKRSQSAHLPSASRWSIPQASAPGGKKAAKSSLCQVSSPDTSSEPNGLMNPAQTSEDKSENVASKDYSLFSDSSIWYSPFQSGLDISIESDQEHGKHRSRSNSGPRIQIDSSNTQSNPNLSQLLPPSSFFESSPRTPRIMPFNQHHQENTLDIERWSTRRSPPLLASSTVSIQESDYVNPRDYFRGSQSASSSRRASIENNLTESLLCGRSRMFASSPPSSSISRPLPLSEENNGLISGSIFLPPQFNSSATPAASTVFASNPVASTPSVINHSIRTENRFSDPIEPQFPAFMNPWETNYSYQTEPTTSEAFLAFGSSSTLSTVDHATDRDRHSSLLRVMNADNRIGSNGSSEGLHHMQDKEIEREAIRQGFFFPSLAHHSNASLSSADTTSFHPYASIEMSLAAAANQPPPLFKELQYNFVELTIQDVMKNQVATEESNQIQSSPIEINEKKPKDRHRHGRSRSGHHKSASLGSFFSSGPSATDVPDSGTVDVQSNTRGTSSSNRTIHNGGLTIHSRQGRYQGHGTGKDFDGASTISGRHRTVTDQETRHKNVSKQQHFDSNSLKRSLKKDHHF